MTRLGAVIGEAIVHHYGRDELLRRLAHPFWFQCFGAVMGMDWHSSGITTSVIGALKRGLSELAALEAGGAKRAPPAPPPDALLPHLDLPAHHDVRPSDVVVPRVRCSGELIAGERERSPRYGGLRRESKPMGALLPCG